MNHLGTALLLALSLGFSGCKKDKDENDDIRGPDGENAQDQIYTENLDPQKPLLVVYGDSISTGVLANTTLGQNPDNSLTLQLTDYVKGQDFNAAGFQESLSNLDLAVSSTVESYGIRASLAAQNGLVPQDIGLMSFAKFGAKARDLPAMFSRWKVENQNTIAKKPDYILVMLGGNDFCSDFTVEEILKDYREQTNAIHADAPLAQMIIVPGPPADKAVAIDFTYAPALTAVTGEELSCRKFRDTLCKPLNGDPAAIKARLSAINSGIEAQAEALSAAGANVKFVDGMLNWELQAEDLAVDCFHPSLKGQTLIGGFIKDALAQ